MTTLEAYEIVMKKVQDQINRGVDFRMKFTSEYGVEPDPSAVAAGELPYDKWVSIWTPLNGNAGSRILSELHELGIWFDTSCGGNQWSIDWSLNISNK